MKEPAYMPPNNGQPCPWTKGYEKEEKADFLRAADILKISVRTNIADPDELYYVGMMCLSMAQRMGIDPNHGMPYHD